MNITKSDAIEIFESLGFATAANWQSARLTQKIQKIKELQSDAQAEKIKISAPVKKMIKQITTALDAGEAVEVEADAETQEEAPKTKAKGKRGRPAKQSEEGEEAEAESEEAPKAKGKRGRPAKTQAEGEEAPKVKGKGKAKSADAGKKQNTEKDAFGQRLGTGAAAINAALTKKPQGVDEIASASDQKPARVRTHMKYLLDKGLIVEAEGKYKIA